LKSILWCKAPFIILKRCLLDSDGDGGPDHPDECLQTPKGVNVERMAAQSRK
jgi:hypothetical protein